MPNRLQRWVAANALMLLVWVGALTLLALSQVVDFRTGTLRISVDPSLDAISTQSEAERAYTETIRLRFGSSEPIIVVVRTDDVFTTENLIRIDDLSRALGSLDGVESVRSVTASVIPRIEGDVLYYSRLTSEDLRDPALPPRLRESTQGNPLIEGQLVSPDGSAAVILINPGSQTELEMLRSDLAARILATADAAQAEGVDIYVTGATIVRSEISATVTRQLQRVVPAIVVVITGLLALAFPSVRGVLVPVSAIAIALIWLLGTLCFLGRPINLITALVPPFIVTMGLAYCAHVLAEYEALIRVKGLRDPVKLIAELLSEVSVPVMVTGLTTIAGLLALMLNDQQSMIEFAWLSALGTAYLLVLMLTYVPAALRYARPKADPGALPATWAFEVGGEKLSRFDQQRRTMILGVALAVFIAAMLLATRIQVGDVFVGVFEPEARVWADYEAANAAIGGVNPLDIAIEGGAPEVFTDPGVLANLAELQTWLEARPEVGAVMSMVDHVHLLNRYLGRDPSGAIPESRDVIIQLLFAGEGELLRNTVNSNRSSTLMRVRLTVDDTLQIGNLLDDLRERLSELPPGLSYHLSGSAVLMTDSVRTATTGQLKSVALALGLILLALSIQFMSLRVGFLASLPTALQTGLYFGALGLLSVPLNPTTVLVECLVLGLAIDDTIHYLARFARAAKSSGSESIAAASALRKVLRPVTLTKAILAIGFLTMLTGELRNQALFGWLAALTLFCAWLVDAFVTPALMSGLRIVTLWDTLRLNLGDRVQETIPLFRGLTNRQARVFALMANLHSLPPGTRLITEGDAAGSIYVVIDGVLSVYSGRGADKTEIKQMRRGDVVGEHGYFGQRRLANVDTVTQARLLRFDDDDQERICTAYPEIAARVFLSLNRLQAERHGERMPGLKAPDGRSLADILADEPTSFDSTLQ